jgi:hypothetical protein
MHSRPLLCVLLVLTSQIYETLLYILTPFTLPISFIVRPEFCIALIMATLGLYLLHVIIFNEVHLRLKKERVCWKVVLGYYVRCRCPLPRTFFSAWY